MTQRQLFLEHLAQTSTEPLAINMVKADGCTLWDDDGRAYTDLIGGISVCAVGHRNPEVVRAIKDQADRYLHIMVYGELIENPQIQYAQQLVRLLPSTLNSVFFTNSGAEAVEGAMKLAKRFTGRPNIACFKNSYHGSTQGALSLMGSEYFKQAYRPLLPGIRQLRYNEMDDLNQIDETVACVVTETIQAEAGVVVPSREWINALRERCNSTGTLLVLDEIQCGFGRNGTLWAFQQFGIVPDILLLGKALGGGMPLGAFIADKKMMQVLSHNPVLGHITTFGGHPVCCAAGAAALEVLTRDNLVREVAEKEKLFLKHLTHPKIKRITHKGLMLAVWMEDFETNKKLLTALLKEGVFSDWFLFAPEAMRIVPPLTITAEEIENSCSVIRKVLDTL